MSIIGSLPYSLTNGTTADATQVMADLNTIVNGVNNATTGAAPIPSLQASLYNYAADTGTVNALIISPQAPPSQYSDGMSMTTKAANTNTSRTVTAKFGSLAAKSVVIDAAGSLPPIGSIVQNMHYRLEYDSTQDKLILMNPSMATGSFTGTGVGFTTNPSDTFNYATNGAICFISGSTNVGISGTSNSTSFSITGLVTDLFPSATRYFTVCASDSGTASASRCSIDSSGVWTFYNASSSSATSWTGSGIKLFRATTLSYAK